MAEKNDEITITLSARFIKDITRLQPSEQVAASEKIELFKNRGTHAALKVHKLHGKRKDEYAFSITYSYRAIFSWLTASHALLHTITTHDGY